MGARGGQKSVMKWVEQAMGRSSSQQLLAHLDSMEGPERAATAEQLLPFLPLLARTPGGSHVAMRLVDPALRLPLPAVVDSVRGSIASLARWGHSAAVLWRILDACAVEGQGQAHGAATQAVVDELKSRVVHLAQHRGGAAALRHALDLGLLGVADLLPLARGDPEALVGTAASDSALSEPLLLRLLLSDAWTGDGVRVAQVAAEAMAEVAAALSSLASFRRAADALLESEIIPPPTVGRFVDGLGRDVDCVHRSQWASIVVRKCLHAGHVPAEAKERLAAAICAKATTFAPSVFGSYAVVAALDVACGQRGAAVGAILDRAVDYVVHPSASYVVEAALAHASEAQVDRLAAALEPMAVTLAGDRSASRVLDRVLAHASAVGRAAIVNAIVPEAVALAQHRVGSHVVRQALRVAPPDARARLSDALSAHVQQLMQHSTGHFILCEAEKGNPRLRGAMAAYVRGLEAQVDTFHRSSQRSLSFPPTLSSFTRKQLHQYVANYGDGTLRSMSIGEGTARAFHVWKVHKVPTLAAGREDTAPPATPDSTREVWSAFRWPWSWVLGGSCRE